MEQYGKFRLRLIVAITLICHTTGVTSGPGWYYCHHDVCDTETDFCSEDYKRCRSCTEVLDDCFTPQLQTNCSSFCIKHKVEKKMKEAKEKPCATPNPILHGKHNGSLRELHNQGAVIECTCDTRYRLNGSRYITCKEYGEWTTGTPTCEEVLCPLLNDVTNGKHNGTVLPLKPGDTVVTSCAYGHQLYGKNFTVCNSNGFWTNPLPICEGITCSKIHPIKHGFWYPLQLSREKVKVGGSLKAECDIGFVMDGQQIWNCSHNGNWIDKHGSFMPICYLVGESSEGKLSLSDRMIWPVVTLLIVSGGLNIGFIVYIWRIRQGIVKQEEVQKNVEASDDTPTDEQTKLLDSTNAVSLRDRKPSKANKNPARKNLSSEYTPSVKYETEGLRASSNSTSEGPGAGIVLQIHNHNNNSNNNNNNNNNNNSNIISESTEASICQQPNLEPQVSVNGTKRTETQLETGWKDRTPIEETGTVHPIQPESSTANTDVKFTENLKNAEIVESYSNEISPEEQTVNNEQDIAQKVVLPDAEINTDDINV